MRTFNNVEVSYMLKGLSEVSALIVKDGFVVVVTVETQDLKLLRHFLCNFTISKRSTQVILVGPPAQIVQ